MALILDGTTGVPVTTVTGTLPVANGGSGVTTSTGSGANVLGTSPTITTPTFDSASLPTISGTAPLYMCRAWVNFDGTGTPAIRSSGNVSSITDSAVGSYIVNFTTAMPDVNFAVAGSAGSKDNDGTDNGVVTLQNRSTSSVSIITRNVQSAGSTTDYDSVNVVILR